MAAALKIVAMLSVALGVAAQGGEGFRCNWVGGVERCSTDQAPDDAVSLLAVKTQVARGVVGPSPDRQAPENSCELQAANCDLFFQTSSAMQSPEAIRCRKSKMPGRHGCRVGGACTPPILQKIGESCASWKTQTAEEREDPDRRGKTKANDLLGLLSNGGGKRQVDGSPGNWKRLCDWHRTDLKSYTDNHDALQSEEEHLKVDHDIAYVFGHISGDQHRLRTRYAKPIRAMIDMHMQYVLVCTSIEESIEGLDEQQEAGIFSEYIKACSR